MTAQLISIISILVPRWIFHLIDLFNDFGAVDILLLTFTLILIYLTCGRKSYGVSRVYYQIDQGN